MTGQAIKKVLLTEVVYSKAPSMLTSALLAEQVKMRLMRDILISYVMANALMLAKLPCK